MSSNKDTTTISYNDSNNSNKEKIATPKRGLDQSIVIEEYTAKNNRQNSEKEDELNEINEDEINEDEINDQIDYAIDEDSNDEISKIINTNLEKIKMLSNNKYTQQFLQNQSDSTNSDQSENNEQDDDDNEESDDQNNEESENEESDEQNNEESDNEEHDEETDESDNEEHDESDDESNESNEANNQIENENESDHVISTNQRKKRGLPKTMLANQQKYFEALERQQKMINSKKDKKKVQNNKKNKNNTQDAPKKQPTTNPAGTRRVIVAGKVKFLPIKSETETTQNVDPTKKIQPLQTKLNTKAFIKSSIPTKSSIPIKKSSLISNKQKGLNTIKIVDVNDDSDDDDIETIPVFKVTNPTKQSTKQSIPVKKSLIRPGHNNASVKIPKEIIPSKILQNDSKIIVKSTPKSQAVEKLSKLLSGNNNDELTEPTKKIPSSIANKMAIHKANVAKQIPPSSRKNKQQLTSGKKLPSKYAKQIENDVKKQTVKNVRNFSDLRRIKALQDITTDTQIDASKASIIELRKLRTEQRKKDQAEQRKRNESNKRESAIQEILRNDKMSKFAKTVAIKNLSVNSRNRKNLSKINAEN